jgi:hypothetical protein
MRCEDCLPLIEEYFDGEVKGQAAASVRAHLSTCADCAAALDALSFEQEIYARYDRGGLEVTPALWARVSAEIARTPPVPESPAAGRPFLSRARDHFAAALGLLAVRPALASSMALLVVAAAAGTLWLARRSRPAVPAQEVARYNTPAAPAAAGTTAPNPGVEDENPKRLNPFIPGEDGPAPAAYEPRVDAREVASVGAGGGIVRIAPDIVATQDDVERLLATPPAPQANPNVVVIDPNEHDGADAAAATAALIVNASAPAGDLVASNAQPLDPGDKDVALHVERAQMLLRSIKNTRASAAGEADIAYEKNLSRKLLAENATLQLEAEVKGDKETKQVLDQIEPFLLEIANMGEKPSREEVRSIRERVRKDEIVAALQVY